MAGIAQGSRSSDAITGAGHENDTIGEQIIGRRIIDLAGHHGSPRWGQLPDCLRKSSARLAALLSGYSSCTRSSSSRLPSGSPDALEQPQLVESIRHLVAIGKVLDDTTEGLCCGIQLGFRGVELTEPVMGVGGQITVRILLDEVLEGLPGSTEIPVLNLGKGGLIGFATGGIIAGTGTRR